MKLAELNLMKSLVKYLSTHKEEDRVHRDAKQLLLRIIENKIVEEEYQEDNDPERDIEA